MFNSIQNIFSKSAAYFSFNEKTLFKPLIAIILSTVLLAISSKIQVPLLSVPVTMQSMMVVLIGSVLGARLGALAVSVWLLEAALGLPVLASPIGGIHYFFGPTAGYLFTFPLAAGVVGYFIKSKNYQHFVSQFIVMCLGNLIPILGGVLWLSIFLGMKQAFLIGALPFLLIGIIKSALNVATLKIISKIKM